MRTEFEIPLLTDNLIIATFDCSRKVDVVYISGGFISSPLGHFYLLLHKPFVYLITLDNQKAIMLAYFTRASTKYCNGAIENFKIQDVSARII